MPQPERSVGRAFSRLGRLENAWARAVAEPDPATALARLRDLYPRLDRLGPAAAGIWPSFQDSVLAPRFFSLLTDTDFDRLRTLGPRLAADGVVDFAQTWSPLIRVLLVRGFAGDRERASALLTDLYGAPAVSEDIRSQTAVALAGLGATGPAQLSVYADVMMRQAWPPLEVARLVVGVLGVGFDSDQAHLSQAYDLATKLSGAHRRPEVVFALGLGELLLYRRPHVAVQHFTAALEYGMADGEGLRGLFSAHLYAREFGAVVAISARSARLSPRCAELVTVCRMLAWFEASSPSIDSMLGSVTPPATAAQLAQIAPGPDLGPWRDYALGRSHLHGGDAAKAGELLARLPGTGPPDVEVHYHLAWARLLCQDPDSVRAGYAALADGPGGWALGCLLLDAEPGQPLPAPQPQAPDALRQVGAIRQALAGEGPLPTEANLRPLRTAGLTQPDLFETLRTELGVAVAQDWTTDLKALFQDPLFARLPAAERLLWSALAVRASDPEHSRLTLHQARALGRDRAAVLLALDALDNGWFIQVHQLLRDVRGPKAELLRAWADAHLGATRESLARFERLADRGLGQADYAMALLTLRDAAQASAQGQVGNARRYAGRAETQFASAAARSHGRIQTAHLERAAQSLTLTDDVPNWQDVAEQTWTARLLGLVRLIRTPESVNVRLLQALPEWIRPGAGDSPAFTAGVALSRAVLRVVLLTEDAAARQAASELLKLLAERFPGAETARAAQRGAACTALRTGHAVDLPSDDPLTALVAAGELLAGADRDPAEAVRRLRDAGAEDDQRNTTLVALFAEALDGRPLPNPFPAEVPAQVQAALAAATAAGQAERNPSAAVDTLLAVLGTYDMNGLVDLPRVLPHLALRADKGGRREASIALLVPILRQAAEDAEKPGGVGSLAAARFAAIAGDDETADRCFQRALELTAGDDGSDDGDRDGLRREYGLFLCRLAVLADNRTTTLALLDTATGYLPGEPERMLADLEDDESVRALLRFLFPGSPILGRQRQGRHPRLADLLSANPGLRHALAARQAEDTAWEWQNAVERDGDIELRHTLAVLALEDALAARPADPRAALQSRLTATALWMALLADPGLKEHFAQLSMPDQADARLHEHIVKELLDDQKIRLTQAAVGGDLDTARVHARCLIAVRFGLMTTRKLLDDGPFAPVARQMGTKREFDPIAARAADLLEEWGVERVKEGERRLHDPVAIRKLAKTYPGLDADYESAAREAEVVVAVGLTLKSVLRNAVDWHTKWLQCASDMKHAALIEAATRSVKPFIDRLEPQCTLGRAHLAENRTLAEHFLVRGVAVLDDDPMASLVLIERSLEWDPSWQIAASLLERAAVDVGLLMFDEGDYPGLQRIVDRIPGARERIAVVLNNRSVKGQKTAEDLITKLSDQSLSAQASDIARLQSALAESEFLLLHAVRIDPDATIRSNLDEVQSLKQSLPKLLNNFAMEVLDTPTNSARSRAARVLNAAELLLREANQLDPHSTVIAANLNQVRMLKRRLNA